MGDLVRCGSGKSMAGTPIVLVGPAGLAQPVPLRPAPGCCGITVTEVGLSEGGVVSALRGVWRAEFGSAATCVGDIVLELIEPHAGRIAHRRPDGPSPRPGAGSTGDGCPQVGIRLLAACRALSQPAAPSRTARSRADTRRGSSWLWLGSWPCVGTDWPFLVGPLTFITWHQEKRAAHQAGQTR